MIRSSEIHRILTRIIIIKSSWYVFNIPEVKNDIIIPETIPPAVSIENDFPGTKLFSVPANDNQFYKRKS